MLINFSLSSHGSLTFTCSLFGKKLISPLKNFVTDETDQLLDQVNSLLDQSRNRKNQN
jgi:hypothetical protein